ncbi:PAS domain-containing protein [Tamlana sp. 62-3]|uniref:PAS domain-containing protein n=1 Tax=Neotamlana sargassicola TaxID=2883125 RepID=A0A9X1I2G9_9FLAO|nr:PAS domain-containing protein [Tamlana sargassicola]MCB4806711.1 PAS domain-containing protein [Tamlana sargassicola]
MLNKTAAEDKPSVFTLDNYKILYDSSPDMLLSVCASTTKILECNNTLAKTLNTSKDKLIGKSVFSIYHHDCIESVENAFKTFIEKGRLNNLELILKNKTPILLKVEAIRNVYGEIIYSNSCLRDISNTKHIKPKVKKKKENDETESLIRAYNSSKKIAQSLKLIKDSAKAIRTQNKTDNDYSKTMKDIERRMENILETLNED